MFAVMEWLIDLFVSLFSIDRLVDSTIDHDLI